MVELFQGCQLKYLFLAWKMLKMGSFRNRDERTRVSPLHACCKNSYVVHCPLLVVQVQLQGWEFICFLPLYL